MLQAQSTNIVCIDGGKKSKSSGGYKRHRAAKHNNSNLTQKPLSTLTPSILSEIVAQAIKNVKESEVFGASLRTELTEYEYMYEELNEETHEFSVMQTLFNRYLKNGNAEKFYGKFYAQVPLNAANFFQGLSRNSATLLATKVANSMLTYCKNMMSLLMTVQHPTQRYRTKRKLDCSI